MTLQIGLVLAQLIQAPTSLTCSLPPPREFAKASPETRLAVMKRVDICAAATPEATFGLIEAGLSDTDQQVRVSTAAAVRTLRSAVTRLRMDSRMARTVTVPDSFLSALARSLDSSDVSVRHQSFEALVEFDGNRTRTKAHLLERYKQESAPLLRASLLRHLREIAPNDAAVRQVVLGALDDLSADVRLQAIHGARVWTPGSALATVGACLDTADISVRMTCVEALAAYGSRAKAFIERLQLLLADDTNPRRRRQIEFAIRAITRP